MKLKFQIQICILLLSLLLLPSLRSFAEESYTITGAQIASLSQNLTTLKGLTLSLRQQLWNSNQELQAIAQELKASEAKLERAEDESNTFILKLVNQQNKLTEQSKSLTTAKKSLKRLRRRDKAKNILFMLIIGGLVASRR